MNYKEHLIANFMILSFLLILHQAYPILILPQLLLFLFGFFIGSFFLTPDVDIRDGTLFYPIKVLTHHHGVTHYWFVGSVVILSYVFIIISLFSYALYGMVGVSDIISRIITYQKEIIVSVGGVVLSNVLHILIDKIT